MRDHFSFDDAEAIGPEDLEDRFGPARGEEARAEPQGPRITWYGDVEPAPPLYLVRGLLPQVQTAIVSGQFSAGKTTICSDLSYSVMTGEPFAGHEIVRPGAVLWLGAEGAGEVDFRMKATALHRSGREMTGELPFARQSFDVPTLTDADALPRLLALVEETKAGLASRFAGTDLVLIVVDTLASAAAFADENSASETQKVMAILRKLSDASGALVLAVDHHGKAAETGVRGSSAKSGAADAILAALADKSMEGEISNRRLAIVKLRSGVTGKTIPFSLKPVQVDVWGNTSCGVEWQTETVPQAHSPDAFRNPWKGKAQLLRRAMLTAMIEAGKPKRPYGHEGAEVKAVDRENVRVEFYASFPSDGGDPKQDTKRRTFGRLMEEALAKQVIGGRELSGIFWVWFTKDEDAIEAQQRPANPDTRPDTDKPF